MATLNGGATTDDSLVGGGTNDVLNGWGGNDTLNGAAGNDTMSGGDGADRLLAGDGSDYLTGDAGADTMYGEGNNDTLYGGTENDVMYGGLGSDKLYGEAGNDYLSGDGGNESLDGGIGDDTLFVTTGTNTLIGGTGNDTIVGGTGADRYNYTSGDGNDMIDDKGGVDVLYFSAGITSSDVRFTRNTNTEDLTITVLTTGDVITVKYHFISGGTNLLESVSFNGTSSLTSAQIATLTQVLYGTSSAEMILGWSAGCTFNGAGGADTLVGSTGNDTFNWAAGNGNDQIYAKTGTDVLAFSGSITQSNLQFQQNFVNNDLNITVLSTGEVITVRYHFWGNSDALESITFSNGTSMNTTDIAAAVRVIYGTSGSEQLVGWSGGNTFIGGTGNDTMAGTASNDVFYYASGDGSDVIYTKDGTDTLGFTGAITQGDLTFARNPTDESLQISVGGATITIKDHFNSSANSSLDFIAFASGGATMDINDINAAASHYFGTSSGEMLVGWSTGVSFHGEAGNDTLVGGAGNDTFYYAAGDGNDVIYAKGGTDTLAFTGSISQSDLRIYRDFTTNDLNIDVISTGAHIVIRYHFVASSEELESITFTSGGSMNLAAINAAALNIYGDSASNLMYGLDAQNDILHGYADNDSLYGRTGNDELIGGTGVDGLFGGGGADTFVFDATNESLTTNPDVIGDFSHAEGDTIQLSSIGSFSFLGTSAFTGAGNEIRYGSDGSGNTLVHVDTNGDSVDDMVIKLIGNISLVSSDFS